MRMTFYTANCRGNAKNNLYPNKRVVDNEDDSLEVMAFDHVCGEFKDFRRSGGNFLSSDVEVMDCDNDHSDAPGDWIYPKDLEDLLGADVAFFAVPSRNHMKPKDGKSARPRFHVYFPHDPVTDGDACAALKRAIQQKFPFFDAHALDAARFIFGNPTEEIFWHEGEITIDCIVKPQEKGIPQGQRNSTLSHFAGRVVKRYGASEKAHQIFMEEADKCNPPLPDEELASIWQSACRFAEKVQSQEGYVSPEDYNDEFCQESLKPADYSDIGQAKVLAKEYGVELRYTAATDYIRFCGAYWVESKQQAVGAAEEFLDLQLADAKDDVRWTRRALLDVGVAEDDIMAGGKALEKKISGGQTEDEEGNLVIEPAEAEVVKRIYREYLEGASLLQIGRGLEADGILTGAGKTKWRPETLKKILQNEKYIGDALLQKTYTVDFLNKKRVQNKGIVPQYYVENSHEPIIPRDLYMQVQEEMIRRANLHSGANRKKRVYSSKYALSSIVYCSKCGEIYRRIAWNNRGKHSTVWRCCTRVEHGPTACDAPTIQEPDLQAAVVQAINLTLGNRESMMATLQENVEAVIRQEDETSSEGIENKLLELQKELLKLANSKKDYNSVADEIDRLRELKQNAMVESAEREGLKQRIREMREFLEQQSTEVTEYDELLVRRLIEKITVYDERFEVEFKSGAKVDVE